MEAKLKQEIDDFFLELKEQLEIGYNANIPFETEKDCIDWYSEQFDLIDSEEKSKKQIFTDHDDKREVDFSSSIARDFLKEKLMKDKENYNYLDFDSFALKKCFSNKLLESVTTFSLILRHQLSYFTQKSNNFKKN